MTPTPPQGYRVTDADEVVEIPVKVIAMLSWAGYMAMFWDLIQTRGYNHRQSWEACERTLAHFKLPERYSSYESFKAEKYRLSLREDGGDVIKYW